MIGGGAGQDIPGRGRGSRAPRDRHEHWVCGRAVIVPLPNVREGRGRSETELQIMVTPVPQTLCPCDLHSRVMRPAVPEPLCVPSDPEPLVELPPLHLGHCIPPPQASDVSVYRVLKILGVALS